MMAADPGRAGDSAGAPRVLDDMHDGPGELAPGHPLHEALALCRDLLGSCHDAAAARVAESARRRATLGAWAGGAAAVAALIAVVSTVGTASTGRPPAADRAFAFGAAAAALASLVVLGLRGVVAPRRAWLADRVRMERCRRAKFRFLLDPSLWSRRGDEAKERVEQLRADAAAIAALGPGGAEEWAAADAVPAARTIPVGSGIDPHTVHTLMDYYQARRIDPELARLAAESASAGSDPLRPGPAVVLGASVAAILLAELLRLFSAAGAKTSAVVLGLALFLPFAAAALRTLPAGRLRAARRRSLARHRALAELSERLQKVSGAEAIFRELGFCEDVLDGEGRDALRRDLASGWLA